MINPNINISQSNISNINKIINNDNKKKEKNSIMKAEIILKYDFIKKECNKDMTLFDLKKYINTKFHIQEYEYEIFIGEHNINCLSDDTSILNVLNKYNLNIIIIKAYKNIIDILNELNNYEHFLTKKISLKDNEIKKIKEDEEKINEDLKKFN